jgi:hypothetical protein
MATQITHGATVQSFVAGADLTASQSLFVKLNASGQVVPVTAITDSPIGVLLNAPASGFEALVALTGIIKVIASAAVTAGAVLSVDAAGKAVTVVPGTDTTRYQVGRALTSASAANVVFQASIDTLTAGRAS